MSLDVCIDNHQTRVACARESLSKKAAKYIQRLILTENQLIEMAKLKKYKDRVPLDVGFYFYFLFFAKRIFYSLVRRFMTIS